MEICILYALEVIPTVAVKLRVPLDEIIRRYGLGPEDFMFPEDEFEKRKPDSERSEFSLGDVFKQLRPDQGFRTGPILNPGPLLRIAPR